MSERPKVGVGVIVLHEGRMLIGRRQGAHGADTWAPPGGHLEHNESWEDCARREVLEEAGVQIENVMLAGVTNDPMPELGKHYITIFMKGTLAEGQEPRICEPDKCAGWEWHSWDELPEPRFLPLQNIIEQGYHPFTTRHDKLVRDLIPAIIQSKGIAHTYHIADVSEYERQLRTKLVEEVLEYLQSKSPEELADVLEVVHTLSAFHAIPRETLESFRAQKLRTRGGLEDGIILETTTES